MSATFRFRLDRVLSLREHEEDEAREGFAVQMRRTNEAEGRVVAAADHIAKAGETQRNRLQAACTGADLHALQAFRERTELQRLAAVRELARVRVELDRARADLTVAHQNRRALSTLRERKLDAHRAEQARHEAALLDDIAGRRTGAAA